MIRTPERQRELLNAAGVPELGVELLLGLDHMFATSVLAETTYAVEQFASRPPRSVADWLAENLKLLGLAEPLAEYSTACVSEGLLSLD